MPSDQTIATTQTPATPASGQTFLVQSMAELLKVQTQMLAAHAQAASVQSLPALTPFTGEESQSHLFDEDFDTSSSHSKREPLLSDGQLN